MPHERRSRIRIQADVQNRLMQEWLPVLRQVRKQRRPIRLLLIAIILIPLVMTIALIVHMWTNDFKAVEAAITGALMSVVAAAVIYLGKIQACDDTLAHIELVVLLGYAEDLVQATGELGCYGSFKGAMDDVRKSLAA